MNTGNARILIVDDHPLVRDGLKLRLRTQPGWEVCGEAETAAEAMTLVRRLTPDVAIIDLALRQGCGMELVKQIAAAGGLPRILVCSMLDENLYAQRAIQAGAMGFISKQQASHGLVAAMRRVLEGRVYLSDAVADRVLLNVLRPSSAPKASPVERLTDRELAVFEAIGQGLTVVQIAQSLHLSAKTVETYRDRAKRKLSLRTSAEFLRYAVLWAAEHAVD